MLEGGHLLDMVVFLALTAPKGWREDLRKVFHTGQEEGYPLCWIERNFSWYPRFLWQRCKNGHTKGTKKVRFRIVNLLITKEKKLKKIGVSQNSFFLNRCFLVQKKGSKWAFSQKIVVVTYWYWIIYEGLGNGHIDVL